VLKELIDRQDYPGLVRYAKQQAERYPNYSHDSGKGTTLIMNRWFKEKYFC